MIFIVFYFAPWGVPGGPKAATRHAQPTPKATNQSHFWSTWSPKWRSTRSMSPQTRSFKVILGQVGFIMAREWHLVTEMVPYTPQCHPKPDPLWSSLARLA